MRQKLLLFAIAALMILSCTACGKEKNKEKKSVRDDFVKLIGTDIPEVEKKEIEIMNTYNGYFTGDKVDTEALLSGLENSILPQYEEFLKSIEAISVDNEEVKAVKELYYSSMDYQFQALKKVDEALKENKTDYQTEASELLRQAEDKYAEYKTAVEKMAVDNNVTIVN
ncbi:MAG: hypothetical protein ACI4EF_08235 [Coprococcus sp.]